MMRAKKNTYRLHESEILHAMGNAINAYDIAGADTRADSPLDAQPVKLQLLYNPALTSSSAV